MLTVMKITVRDFSGKRLSEEELKEKQITNELYYINKQKIEKRITENFDNRLM